MRHLVNQEELLGLRLLSLHNLHFLLELTAGARAAIERGELGGLHGRGARQARRRPTGGPLAQLILIVAMFALLWLFLIRPQRARAQAHQELVDQGRASATRSSPWAASTGTCIEIDEDDDLMLEIAPGTQVRIARRAVAAVVPPDEEHGRGDEQPSRRAKKQNATRKSAANLLRCFREP